MNPYIQYMYSYPHKIAYRPLKDISLWEYTARLEGGGCGLYLHIPFCQTKCGYCNLFSVAGQETKQADAYLDAVERQSRQYEEILSSVKTEFSEVTIGGGTPLFLTEKQLERMFGILKEHFRFEEGRELVIETAPNQTTAEKLNILKQAGVTRVSMGIQSFFDAELAVLKRQHSAGKARESLMLLKSYDFPCVNLDFIYGIPGQTIDSLQASLKEAICFLPDEIFLYPLYVKHGAGLIHAGIVPDHQLAYRQYQSASRFLQQEGFRQDSMRRFVRQKGTRCYSECGFSTSLSVGCGGRSYLGNLHFCSPYAVTKADCLMRLKEYETETDFTKITHGILLSEEEMKRRYVIRHLLIWPGLDVRRYQEHFGKHVFEDFPLLKGWLKQGYIEQGAYLALTETGMGLSDYLGPQLISREVRKAMEEWEERHGR